MGGIDDSQFLNVDEEDIVDIVKGWILWILCSDEDIVKGWWLKVK